MGSFSFGKTICPFGDIVLNRRVHDLRHSIPASLSLMSCSEENLYTSVWKAETTVASSSIQRDNTLITTTMQEWVVVPYLNDCITIFSFLIPLMQKFKHT